MNGRVAAQANLAPERPSGPPWPPSAPRARRTRRRLSGRSSLGPPAGHTARVRHEPPPQRQREAAGPHPAAGEAVRACTARLRALEHDVAICAPDPRLVAYLDDVLADLAAAGTAAATYDLEEHADGVTLRLREADGAVTTVGTSAQMAGAVALLLWHLNRRAVDTTPGLLRLHAGGVERGGRLVVLPGGMEAGKTTLVAGLLRRGFGYASDEVVALDRDTLALRPYPKPLSIDPGSWEVLADLAPQLDAALAARLPAQWQVPAHAIGAPVAAAGSLPALLVFPQHDPQAATTLTPISAADAALELTRCTFDFEAPRDLPALGLLAERCARYRLTASSLAAACAAVEQAADDVDHGGT